MAAHAPPKPICIANICMSEQESLQGVFNLLDSNFTLRKAKAATGVLRGASMRFVKTASRPDVCARILNSNKPSRNGLLSQQVREINFDSQGSTKMICCMQASAADWPALCALQEELNPDVSMLFYKDDTDLIRLLLKQLRALQSDTQLAVKRSCAQRSAAQMATEQTAATLADCVADLDGNGHEQSLAFELTTVLHGLGSVRQLALVDSLRASTASALSDRSAERLYAFVHGGDAKSSKLK